MASLFFLRLAFFNFVTALANFFFLFLGLALPAVVFRRRHGDILRLRNGLGLLGHGWFRAGFLLFRCRLRLCSHLRLRLRLLLLRYPGSCLRRVLVCDRLLCNVFRLRCVGLRLRLQLRTLDIGAAFADLHIHRLGLPGLEGGCGFPLKGNLVRLCLSVTVALSQIGQQLLLLFTCDSVVFIAGLQARFNDLLQQTIHGSAYICGQLFYRYVRHTGPPLPNQAWSSNQGARAAIISWPARSSSIPSISSRSSTDCSASSSIVRTPIPASLSARPRSIPSIFRRSSAGSAPSRASSLASA